LTADRSKQRGFEQKEAKLTKATGLAFRDGPSTKSRLIALRWAGLVLTADRSKQRGFEQKEAKVTKGKGDWRSVMVLRQNRV
jgi:hypothetical protein